MLILHAELKSEEFFVVLHLYKHWFQMDKPTLGGWTFLRWSQVLYPRGLFWTSSLSQSSQEALGYLSACLSVQDNRTGAQDQLVDTLRFVDVFPHL